MLDIIAMNSNGSPIESACLPADRAGSFLSRLLRQGAKEFRIQTDSAILHLGASAVISLFSLKGIRV